MDFLGVPFEARDEVRVDLPTFLKLVRIMLETLNVTRKYTHMQFWKLYLLVPRLSFFSKKTQHFWTKVTPLLKDWGMLGFQIWQECF